MTRRFVLGLAGLALLTGVLACSNTSNGGQSVSDRATSLAQTAQALLTSTAAASITPLTPTAPATVTPPANAVATASDTPPAPPTTTTAPPTATTANAAPCTTNKADFVADINVPDGTHFAAGAAFQKTWALKNSGDCAWSTAYSLRNVAGDVMSGATINMPNAVPPGATVNLTVSFVAPSSPGTYTSHWQMFTPDGAAFGTKPFVTIKVP